MCSDKIEFFMKSHILLILENPQTHKNRILQFM